MAQEEFFFFFFGSLYIKVLHEEEKAEMKWGYEKIKNLKTRNFAFRISNFDLFSQ